MDPMILWKLSYGVYVVSSTDPKDGRSVGCIANSAMQVTSTPPTIAISINHDNYTHDCIANSGVFAISILSETSAPSLIGRFGFQSSRDTDKFAGISHTMHQGLATIDDSCGYITCKVIQTLDTTTHTIFLGQVTDGAVYPASNPMTYAYYHQVIKGKSPKNAPTYLPQADRVLHATPQKASWRCTVCNYIYTGDIPFEILPEDWRCPFAAYPKTSLSRNNPPTDIQKPLDMMRPEVFLLGIQCMNLTHSHSMQRNLMAFLCNACAASGVYIHWQLRRKSLDQHGVGDDAHIGTQPHQLHLVKLPSAVNRAHSTLPKVSFQTACQGSFPDRDATSNLPAPVCSGEWAGSGLPGSLSNQAREYPG